MAIEPRTRTTINGKRNLLTSIQQWNNCMTDLIVKAAVKDAVGELNVASDFYEALDEEVQELLDDAKHRAQENDRKTVQARDL
jgi:histone H3/H4